MFDCIGTDSVSSHFIGIVVLDTLCSYVTKSTCWKMLCKVGDNKFCNSGLIGSASCNFRGSFFMFNQSLINCVNTIGNGVSLVVPFYMFHSLRSAAQLLRFRSLSAPVPLSFYPHER